jgi:hypothetical protein
MSSTTDTSKPVVGEQHYNTFDVLEDGRYEFVMSQVVFSTLRCFNSHYPSFPHRKTAAAAAAIAPNLASKKACAVGTAMPVERAVVALAAMTDLTMLN